MKHTIMVYENRLLMVTQIPHNSEVLISDLIDICNRLARAYQQEKDLQRQKIILSLKR